MLPRLIDTPATSSLHASFLTELRVRGFAGDVTARYADRTVMATDNSIYQLTPQAILFRRTRTISSGSRDCWQSRGSPDMTLAPRGGGTGTNGQSLTDGIVVDVSRHMNGILEINAAEGWARVQPGVVKDQLNAALAKHGLFFPPELSTSNRATIGGMISTDACGQGSCLYGKTRDHVLALKTVLLDGTVWRSAPLADEELTVDSTAAGPNRGHSPARGHDPAGAGRSDRAAVPQAEPLPDRLRPRAYPRRARGDSISTPSCAARKARSA